MNIENIKNLNSNSINNDFKLNDQNCPIFNEFSCIFPSRDDIKYARRIVYDKKKDYWNFSFVFHSTEYRIFDKQDLERFIEYSKKEFNQSRELCSDFDSNIVNNASFSFVYISFTLKSFDFMSNEDIITHLITQKFFKAFYKKFNSQINNKDLIKIYKILKYDIYNENIFDSILELINLNNNEITRSSFELIEVNNKR